MSERVGIFGASGSGKTSALREIITEAKIDRVIFIDPTGEARRKKWRGFRSAMTLAEVAKIIRKSPHTYKISFEPTPGSEQEDVQKVCAFVIAAQRGYERDGKPIMVAMDEMNLYFGLHDAKKVPGLADLCSRGRHYGVELVGCSQGISEVSTRFRRNLSAAYVLRQMGKADTTAAAELVNMSHEDIKALKNFDILVERNGEVKKKRTRKF